MKVPEKIYIQPLLTEDGIYIRRRVRLQKEDDSIEYCRKDAFIEKSCEWLKKNRKNYSSNALGEEYLIDDFKKAMEE